MILIEFSSEEPQFSKLDVNPVGSEWQVTGKAKFTVNGYGRDEGTVPIQNALSGEEIEVRIGGVPFSIEVPFLNAASKTEALRQAAKQVAAIAAEFLRQAESLLADDDARGR